ncbi:twin-arginine translocation signal domain-containing protein [bacterium]|nr:twin-arginine translocation signal domain-containing protein [bacterium]
MSWSRRDFLKNTLAGSAAAGAVLGGLVRPDSALADFTRTKSRKRLRILILGGTAFLGPALVEHARSRGHEITLFNRGRTNQHLFPDLEKLIGDRDGDLEALRGKTWDVCIDTSGYIPRMVDESAALLRDAVEQYVFISSISVYADFSRRGLNEKSPVGTISAAEVDSARTVRDVTETNYGPLKALCEAAAEKHFGKHACNIRPGLIVGPMDRSGRFTYWPVRIGKGGEVLAPDAPDVVTQVIDVRDLAEFIVHCCERGTGGTFNATSPPEELTMGELFDTCKRVSGSDATFTWVSKEFLDEMGVAAWSDMPVWVPLEGEEAGHPFIDVDRALKAGLTFRPISETVRGTLDWWATLDEAEQERFGTGRAGIKPEREAELLAAWHKRSR